MPIPTSPIFTTNSISSLNFHKINVIQILFKTSDSCSNPHFPNLLNTHSSNTHAPIPISPILTTHHNIQFHAPIPISPIFTHISSKTLSPPLCCKYIPVNLNKHSSESKSSTESKTLFLTVISLFGP